MAKYKPYNPYAYVPGGSSPKVASAIQGAGFADPGPNPAYIPTSSGGGASGTTLPTQQQNLGGLDTSGINGSSYNAAAAPDFSIEDYMGKIQSDPLWGTGEDAFNTSLERGFSTMVQDPFRQAYVAHGGIDMSKVPPGMMEQIQKILDPATIAAAQANPTSTMALLQQALQRGQAGLPYQMGGQRSGGAMVAGRRLNEAFQLQTQQQLQNLLGVLTTGQGKFASHSDQARQAWESAKSSIADRLARAAEASLSARIAAGQGQGGGGGGGGGGPTDYNSPPPNDEWNPPDYGGYADYTPAGTYDEDTGQIVAPGGGTYTSGGGSVYYQPKKGKYGNKPMY